MLTGAVDLDTVAAVKLNGSNTINIQSEGYPLCSVALDELSPGENEINTAALIRGVAAKFVELGARVKALQNKDFDTFLRLIRESGQSSWIGK